MGDLLFELIASKFRRAFVEKGTLDGVGLGLVGFRPHGQQLVGRLLRNAGAAFESGRVARHSGRFPSLFCAQEFFLEGNVRIRRVIGGVDVVSLAVQILRVLA